ncbi:MAG: serine/threonine-protein phosphatase [Planctomycetia bacterium]|nr:serine/threonine-protein phosphatase [Planctomycetia bacterium]
MKILVGWDDASEADLLQLYLSGGGDNDVYIATSPKDFIEKAFQSPWDAMFLSLTYPNTIEEGFSTFSRIQPLMATTSLVMACRPSEMISVPRFVMRGLRFYVYRDPQGDYVFLVLSTIESAVAAYKAEQERKLADQMRQEINGVRLLQEAIIPRGLEPPKGYKAVARYEPAQMAVAGSQAVVMAGGDYYDLFCANDTTLVALVGDASGHGLKACMSIMTMHTLVRMSGSTRFSDTAGFVTNINNLLCGNSIVQSGGGFITLLYVVVDTASHSVTWTSAGHPNALLHRLDDNDVTQVGLNSDGGLPLGIADGMGYDAFTFQMPPRSRLLMYSDGLTDALAPGEIEGGQMWGVAGIIEGLKSCRKRTLEETLEHLFAASNAYTGGLGRHDDTSVLLLERLE